MTEGVVLSPKSSRFLQTFATNISPICWLYVPAGCYQGYEIIHLQIKRGLLKSNPLFCCRLFRFETKRLSLWERVGTECDRGGYPIVKLISQFITESTHIDLFPSQYTKIYFNDLLKRNKSCAIMVGKHLSLEGYFELHRFQIIFAEFSC